MKQLLAAALLFFAPVLVTAQTQILKFHQSGEFASLSQFSPPADSVNLRVSRGTTTTGVTSASLQYSAISEPADFSSLTITNVVGTIPASAFTGNTASGLALDVDTSTLPAGSIFSESCTISFTTGLETCGAGPSGPIHLTFQVNNNQRDTNATLDRQITGHVTTVTLATSDSGTANVQGTVFGATVTGSAANAGMNQSSTLTVTRN